MQKTECFYYVMTILYYLQWFNNKNDNGSGMLEITITKGRSFFFDRFDWQNYFNLLYVMEDILTKIHFFKDLYGRKPENQFWHFLIKIAMLLACLIYQGEKKMHFSIFFHKILVFTPHRELLKIQSCIVNAQ